MKSFKQTPDEMLQLADFLSEDLENIKRVVNFLTDKDVDVDFEVHAKAETCAESAENSPVELSQVTKTLIFIGDKPVAVLCPGDVSVSEEKLEAYLDTDVRMANPSEVKENSGYPIGAVSPFDLDIDVLMEESLLENDEIRPAAGSRAVGAVISPQDVQKVSEAETGDFSR